ncbi:MAG: amino acid adenylation domain-containing protein, partial [Candidatus Aminicenantes bacterium]
MIELNRKNIEDIASLTFMQEGMLFHYLKDPGDDAYFEQLSLRISDHINDQIFKQAWKVVIRTNEMLRTVFRWENLESPIQIVLKKCQLRFKYYDFSGQEDNEAARAVEDIKVKDRKKKFDLRKVPFRVILCKIQESKYEMIISNHHILYDGWSNGIILKEFFEAYEALICRANARPFREHPKTKFKEYIKFKQHQDKEKEKKFWRSYFQGFDTQIGLSVKRGKRRNKTGSENHRVRFERKDKDRLEDFVKRQKLTLASLFYSAWGLLLQKYNSSDDVIFGTTVSGRTAKIHGIENIVGLFINTLPLRVQTTPGETLKDLLRRVDHVLRVREEFENSSLPDIKKYSNIGTKGELFDSIVILENYPLQLSLNNWSGEERDRFSLAVESYSIVEETHYDLTVRITVFEELEVSFIYPEEVFYDGCIVNMSHHFRKIIRQVVTNPMAKISQLEIISREEKNRILYDFNNTGADFPKNRTIHQLFEEQSNRAPFRTALIGTVQEAQSTRMHLEGTRGLAPLSRLITITYGELYERSNQLARLLQEKGIGADTIVAIMMERSVEMMIGIMGILKAGGAYLPIDPGYPGERIKYIMEDSTAKILLTSDAINRVPTPHHLSFHPSILPSFHLHLSPAPAISLAYLIYTSGSTGQPKGVMIGHYSVINRLNWMQAAYPIGPGDMILQKTPLVFDVSVWELFWWSFQGAYLYLLAPGDEKDPGAILEVIERFGVTTMHFVPSMLNAFLDYVETLRSKIGSGRCQFLLKSLKQVFSSGESLGVVQVERFHALFKRCTCPKLINLYGPTEATVDVSYFDCSGKEKLEKVPIGKPIHNIQLVVLDSGLHLQPIGITGELAISGVGLARGYLNQPELTAEKFVLAHSSWLIADRKTMKVPVKFPMSYQLSAISYIYRTGDLARWLPDGNIEFLGRMDQQVKVRGFRIELGEIENHLLVMEEIKDAVVLAREDRPGDKYLCAYIVSQGELELSILRDHLSGRLPDYMIPSYFVQLEEIPLTPNGKVDRKALPEPGISIGKDYTAARDKIEKKLLEIWWEILSRDTLHASQLRPSLGIDDNFFELGGHSLKVILLVAKIHKAFEVKIPLGEVFKRPSIRQLAEYIKAAKKRKYAGIEPVEKKEYYALSSAQKPMYFLQQMDVESTAYNMPCFLLLGKDMEKEKLESAFRELIRRHDSLRTSFVSVNDNPVQQIHDRVEFKIEYYDRKEVEVEVKVKQERFSLLEGTRGLAPLFIKEFIRPFDLSQAPLLRVGLIELPPTPPSRGGHSRPGAPASQKGKEHKYILMLDMHHIISDGVS